MTAMLIPLIKKDPEASDFSCRDGEIDFLVHIGNQGDGDSDDFTDITGGDESGFTYESISPQHALRCSLTPMATYPTANIRIQLEEGESQKAHLLLSGEATRVDPATADRISKACIREAAEELLQLSVEWRRKGCFLLPLRVFTMVQTSDGKLTIPSAQGVALPSDFPPHPEITSYSVADDCLTLSLRFPVKPHRLDVIRPDDFPSDREARLFISYPLYIPDPKEMDGSFGSVKSANGGNATGLRFSFLSSSSIKASVAAPEKYYEMVGNERTGYRISSRLASMPDYGVYAGADGRLSPFPKNQMLICGSEIDNATDPMDWVADWKETGNGYLPRFLPNLYSSDCDSGETGLTSPEEAIFPSGISRNDILEMAVEEGFEYILLTRPMAFADSATSRRKASPKPILSMRIHGLPEAQCAAIWLCSDSGVRWEAMRLLDPHTQHLLLTPPRQWHRLMLLSASKPLPLCIEVETGQL